MRIFFIAIISFFFLSGCGEKDPAKKFMGRYNWVGQTNKGISISEDKTGFLFYPEGQKGFTWELSSDGESLECEGPRSFTLSFDGSLLVGKWGSSYIRYERTK